MDIKERLAEIEQEIKERVTEARELALMYQQGHRDTDLKLPDNVVPFPAHKTMQ
jgi:hypothetical protein